MQQKAADQRALFKVLREAKEAISDLQKPDFSEMKVLNAPPEAILHVMGALCLLFGCKDHDWKQAKKLL